MRAFIFTRIQELMVWPAKNASSEASTICGTGPQRAFKSGLLGRAVLVVESGSAMMTQ